MPPSDQDLLNLTLDTDCYRELDSTEKGKVDKAVAGKPAATPRSNIGKVAFYLARRLHPVTQPVTAELGQNVMFTAQNPAVALRCPTHWEIALSADPAFDANARAVAPVVKQAGHLLAVWGVQTQIGAARIRDFAAQVGADFTIFQAETPEEYDTCPPGLIVGSPNSWTAAQRADAIARQDTLKVMCEVYSNMGQPWPDAASAQGVPVVSEVLGVGWGTNPYQLKDYRPHTPDAIWQGMSVYYAEGMSDESWTMLP